MPTTECNMSYVAQDFTADITVDEYIARFRDKARFLELCKMCPNFGNSWGCPPFDFDTEEYLTRYRYAHLIATRITPFTKGISLEKVGELIRPERLRMEMILLDMERKYGGRAFAFTGKCIYCEDEPCTRPCNKPCRHPDKVRPSLEAFGFNIDMTLKELFGMELLWGKDGKVPEYLVLVGALFHNNDSSLDY